MKKNSKAKIHNWVIIGAFPVESLFKSFKKLYLYRFLEAIWVNWVSAGWNIDVLDTTLTWWYTGVLFLFFLMKSILVKCLHGLLPHQPRDLVWISLLLLSCPTLFFFFIIIVIFLLLLYIAEWKLCEGSDFFFLNCVSL